MNSVNFRNLIKKYAKPRIIMFSFLKQNFKDHSEEFFDL